MSPVLQIVLSAQQRSTASTAAQDTNSETAGALRWSAVQVRGSWKNFTDGSMKRSLSLLTAGC